MMPIYGDNETSIGRFPRKESIYMVANDSPVLLHKAGISCDSI